MTTTTTRNTQGARPTFAQPAGGAVATSASGARPTVGQFKKFSEVASLDEALKHPEMMQRLQQAVPRHLSPERMLRVLAMAVYKTPKLRDANMMTLLGAMLACASLGLEPNTPLGHAHLIPFKTRKRIDGQWTEVTDVNLIIGYKGYIDLARRSGSMVNIHADIVYEGDEFSFEYGTNQHLMHRPIGSREGRRPVWAYCHVKLKDGEAFEVLPYDEVLRVRDGSQGYQYALSQGKNSNTFQTNPWVQYEHEMAAKTMVRRIAKMLPLSIEFANAAALDAMSETGKADMAKLMMPGITLDPADVAEVAEADVDPSTPAAEPMPMPPPPPPPRKAPPAQEQRRAPQTIDHEASPQPQRRQPVPPPPPPPPPQAADPWPLIDSFGEVVSEHASPAAFIEAFGDLLARSQTGEALASWEANEGVLAEIETDGLLSDARHVLAELRARYLPEGAGVQGQASASIQGNMEVQNSVQEDSQTGGKEGEPDGWDEEWDRLSGTVLRLTTERALLTYTSNETPAIEAMLEARPQWQGKWVKLIEDQKALIQRSKGRSSGGSAVI